MGQNGVIRKVISRQRKVVAQKFDRIRDQRPEIDLKTYAACPNSKKWKNRSFRSIFDRS